MRCSTFEYYTRALHIGDEWAMFNGYPLHTVCAAQHGICSSEVQEF